MPAYPVSDPPNPRMPTSIPVRPSILRSMFTEEMVRDEREAAPEPMIAPVDHRLRSPLRKCPGHNLLERLLLALHLGLRGVRREVGGAGNVGQVLLQFGRLSEIFADRVHPGLRR